MTRRRWLLSAVAATLVVALAGVPFYVLPASDEPAPVDVVYVIGPPTDERVDVALGMVRDGQAGAVMVSLDETEADEYPAAASLCHGDEDAWEGLPTDLWVLCSKPDPFTTRGEARALETEMMLEGWDSAAVVTFRPHVLRARMIMERCDTGDVLMVDSGEPLDPWYWVYQYAYQSAAFVKAGVLRGC